ncbi:MAG: T9SS type B sorting domain-containing protein [Saprospiraceae bacterium]|nr:T9SS type B sorting domain-containing protein [Saprospiraceae bacterium]
MEKRFPVIVLLFFFAFQAQGTHIIGGDFSYRCLSTGQYAFTLIMYRDCQSQGAQFDSAPGSFTQASVTIFNGSAQPMDVVFLDAPEISTLDPEAANPCAETPPNVCVQRGIYTFELDLPVSGDSYHIVYQRCCRNPTITNIVNPDAQGMTFNLEITPFAQTVCNNSPEFVEFPPPVVCVGESLQFDHSAFDPDGDQLVYSFCAPKTGGTPNNPAPNPDNPPPYSFVNFVIPFYSPTNPLGGSPQVAINNSTGLITGTPIIEGQFVVGVCVSEFRNGVLLSQTQRDFQFNVTTCNPIINADLPLEPDASLNQKYFDLCGGLDVSIINQSQIEANINEYYWEIQSPSGNFVFDSRNVSFTLPDYGYYPGIMVLNPGSQCKDSLEFVIRATPPLTAEISAVYDTCEVGPVQYLDISPLSNPAFPILEYSWDLDDGFSSEDKFPLVQYESAGVKEISLEFIDTIGCVAQSSASIAWQPAPEIVIVEPSEDEICPETTVLFENSSFPIDDTYTLNWDFGDGGVGGGLNTANYYDVPGTFTVAVEIISPIGCYATDTFTNIIFVDSLPIADFHIGYPMDFSIDNPTIQLEETSIRATGWDWIFPDGVPLYGQEAQYTFRDTGLHTVGLVVQHPFGCYDTLYRQVDVMPVNSLRLPNAFSPNGDGLNEFWGPKGQRLEQVEEYQLRIFDRWGRQIFFSDDPFYNWEGRFEGNALIAGSYPYIIQYKLPRQPMQSSEGVIALIR